MATAPFIATSIVSRAVIPGSSGNVSSKPYRPCAKLFALGSAVSELVITAPGLPVILFPLMQ